MSAERPERYEFRAPPDKSRGLLVRFWSKVKEDTGAFTTPLAALLGATVALAGVFYTQLNSTELEDQRAQSAALQSYLTDVADMEATKDQSKEEIMRSRAQSLNSNTSILATRLSPNNKRILLQFLDAEGLIKKDDPIVSLAGADLAFANLSSGPRGNLSLEETSLSQANLYEADIKSVYLAGADLSYANLERADLSSTDFYDDDSDNPSIANLEGANLNGANLRYADLTKAQLDGADLRYADLRGASLNDVDLGGQDLRQTFEGADLSNAILRGAKADGEEIDFGQLLTEARSLEGAVKPNGGLQELYPWWKGRWWTVVERDEIYR